MFGDFLGIVGALIWAYVSFAWGDVDHYKAELRQWWDTFWQSVVDFVDAAVAQVRDWAEDWFNWLSAWADWVEDTFNYAWGQIAATLTAAQQYAFGLVNGALATLESVRLYLLSQIVAVQNWFTDLYNTYIAPNLLWLLGQVDALWLWITQTATPWFTWLSTSFPALNWLVLKAYAALVSFITNPLSFVLGVLFLPFTSAITFWQQAYKNITTFFNVYAPDVMTLWAGYSTLLWQLVTNPAEFVLEQIAFPFVDWFCGLLADNW